MSHKSSSSLSRRLKEYASGNSFLAGTGLDVRAESRQSLTADCLSLYLPLLPEVSGCRLWGQEDGDAQRLPGLERSSFDFVYSYHCLEHLADPFLALSTWFEVLRPNGHLIVSVPDEDLYEQGMFPSTFNGDHKWTFTIYKRTSWSPNSINVTNLLASLPPHRIKRIQLRDDQYDYSLPRSDQTLNHAEAEIEFVVQKL